MKALEFYIARALGKETLLQALSHPLMSDLVGRGVALVGNARSLGQGSLGTVIDEADLVVRLNSAPMTSPGSHGTRTDWLACSTPLPEATLAARMPSRVLWMTRKRKRLPLSFARHPGFYLHPRRDAQTLAETLGAPPSTGLMVIDLLARSSAISIDLFGFDFFASLSLSGRRSAAQVPHDFAAERRFVEALVARDPRFHLHLP